MGNNITIGNSKEQTSIKTFGPLSIDITSKEKIKLTNCTMESTQAREIIKFDSPQVEVENIILQANNMIQIKDNYHLKKTDEKEITITDKDLSRANLITVLKGYKTILEEQILNNEPIKRDTYITKNLSKKTCQNIWPK